MQRIALHWACTWMKGDLRRTDYIESGDHGQEGYHPRRQFDGGICGRGHCLHGEDHAANSCLTSENLIGIGIGVMPAVWQQLDGETTEDGVLQFPCSSAF